MEHAKAANSQISARLPENVGEHKGIAILFDWAL